MNRVAALSQQSARRGRRGAARGDAGERGGSAARRRWGHTEPFVGHRREQQTAMRTAAHLRAATKPLSAAAHSSLPRRTAARSGRQGPRTEQTLKTRRRRARTAPRATKRAATRERRLPHARGARLAARGRLSRGRWSRQTASLRRRRALGTRLAQAGAKHGSDERFAPARRREERGGRRGRESGRPHPQVTWRGRVGHVTRLPFTLPSPPHTTRARGG
jgi:hypothetical protein